MAKMTATARHGSDRYSVVGKLLRSRDFDSATATAWAIMDETWKGYALMLIEQVKGALSNPVGESGVMGLVHLGELEKAREVARKIDDPELRGRMLDLVYRAEHPDAGPWRERVIIGRNYEWIYYRQYE